jgi:hypothetical protein
LKKAPVIYIATMLKRNFETLFSLHPMSSL